MSNEENIHPVETAAQETLDITWTYSGKAMRGLSLLYWLITFVLLTAGIYLSVTYKLGHWYAWTWTGITAALAVLWGYFLCVYIYRTWTLRYRLTDTRLYTEKGLFTKTSDSMELVYIEDVQLKQTLSDRIFNGGVGHLAVFSSSDKTHQKLIIGGIDNPRYIFEQLDNARAKVRAKRAVLSN